MLRRAVIVVLSVLLSVPAVAIATSIPPFAAQPASAEGFNFLCSAPGSGSGGSSEFSTLANGLALSVLGNQALWFFTGTVPAGVPVTGASTTDPVTGETTFIRSISPRLGQNQGLDFLDGSAVPGAGGNDFTIGLAFRSKAGQRSDPSNMLDLLSQNFGLPHDSGSNDISVAGIDLDFSTNSAVSHMHGFKGLLQAAYQYKLDDGSTNTAVASFRFDASGPGAELPDSGSLDFAFRRPPDNSSTHWVFEQDSVRNDFDGTTNQAGVGYGFGLDRLVGGVRDPLLSADLSWSAAPRSAAIGLGDLCPDESHFAWNITGLPQPGLASVTANVRSGIAEGQTIQVDGPTGPETTQTDSFGLQGSITKLPALIDVILRRDAMSFTRSNDVAPDLDLTRLAMADNDPAHPENLPLFATAHATSMPRHILVTATIDPATGAFTRAELTSWVLSCPGETPPPGPAAPDDVRRLDLPLTLPSFPAGCVRWSLTPIPSIQVVVQNWLPEDLRGQAASAGLATAPLSANQFAYFATRPHNTLSSEALLSFGAKINGLQRATVDLTAPPVSGTGVKLYLERGPVSAADDSAQLVGDVDQRTSDTEALNSGFRVASSATITDLPDRIRVDYTNTPTEPFDFTWRADAGIALTNGTFDVLLPAPTAVALHGAFETGTVGAGGLPPAGDLLLSESADQHTNSFEWSNPAPPADTFPTPDVPPFDPTTITRLHAGSEISTLAQRAAGLAMRVHADIDVPQPVIVTWVTGDDGTISSATGALCDPLQPAACEATQLDATAAMGPRGDLSPASLLTPPTLPNPDGTIQNTVPAFTDFRPDSGARAVILSPNSWGVDLLVRGVARVAYNKSPQSYVVQLANSAPQSFRVQALDASASQVVFADALIDALPQQIRVQLTDGSNNQPIAWVNTENVALTDINSVDFNTTDPPGSRPVITGIVRVGDPQLLILGVPAAMRPTPPRTAAHKGIDLFGSFDADRGRFGVDASFALDLPRHVALFKPTVTECSETASPPVNVDTCQSRPSYEIDRTQTVNLEFKTTSVSLGDLELNGFIGGTNLQQSVHGAIGNVPGQLQGNLSIANNARLPWTTVNTSLTGNAPLQSVAVDVTNGLQPVAYETDGQTQATPNYAVRLTNVPQQLAVNTRILKPESRVSDGPVAPTDPCSPSPGVTDQFGYAHAQLDLMGGNASGQAVLDVAVRQADNQTTAKLTANAPVSGFVNARLDHVKFNINSDCEASTLQRIEVGLYNVVANGVKGAAAGFEEAGPIGLIGGAVIGALIGLFFAIFESPSVTFNAVIDADLPFFAQFDKATEVDVGQNLLTLSVQQNQPQGGDPLVFGFRQKSLDGEQSFSADGAWFHSRTVSYKGSDLGPFTDDFDVHNNIGGQTGPEALATIGVYDHDLCASDNQEHNPCYEPGNDNIVNVSSNTANLVFDPFFNPDNRNELKNHESDAAQISPGTTLFRTFARKGQPVDPDAFQFSDLQNTSAQSATFSLQTNCCADAHIIIGINQPTDVDLGNQGAVCEFPIVDPNSVARATDGTEYTVTAGGTTDAVKPTAERTLCSNTSYVLEAHLAKFADDRLGPLRWAVRLPIPAGLETNGVCQQHNVHCDLSFGVDPQADGSVHVTETTTVVTNGVKESSLTYTIADDPFAANIGKELSGECCQAPDIQTGDTPTFGGVMHALVDASGEPGFWQDGDTAVDTFAATTDGVAAVPGSPGEFTLDPCAIAGFCGNLADGQQLVWLFGDGTTRTVTGALDVQHHVYPTSSTPQPFLGELMLLGPNCSQGASRKCNLQNKAYFKLTN